MQSGQTIIEQNDARSQINNIVLKETVTRESYQKNYLDLSCCCALCYLEKNLGYWLRLAGDKCIKSAR